MNPEEAVKAHIDLGLPQLSIGIHWGTFMKSNEPYLSPIQQLSDILLKQNLENDRFIVTSFGKTLFI